MNKYYYDYIIIGAGITGLNSAINLSKKGRVLLISKGDNNECNTEHAQGGIAAPISTEDSVKLHIKDTLDAGDDYCNEENVKFMIENGKNAIENLIYNGVNFDFDGEKLSLGKEGAHSVNRVLHSNGDNTGKSIRLSLFNKVKNTSNIDYKSNLFALDLITKNNRVFGVYTLDKKNGKLDIYLSKGIIMSTGGCGNLYKNTSNPEVTTGDGIALAYRAGAYIDDMEFIQFHPTTLNIENAPNFLISEAIRGEGAVLLNEKNERFMVKYDKKMELAKRDIVSRAIYEEIKKSKQKNIYLDISFRDKNFIKNRFPRVYNTCLKYGLDITKEYISITPAAHYLMGGISADINCKTNIDGLYACGECANLKVHGANRLASNSLLEGAVFSKIASYELYRYSLETKENEDIDDIIKKYLLEIDYKNIDYKKDKRVVKLKTALRETMQDKVGIIRDKIGLNNAFILICNIQKELELINKKNIDYFELKNMILLSKIIIKSALYRKESRGAHYRSDYPRKNDKFKNGFKFKIDDEKKVVLN